MILSQAHPSLSCCSTLEVIGFRGWGFGSLGFSGWADWIVGTDDHSVLLKAAAMIIGLLNRA